MEMTQQERIASVAEAIAKANDAPAIAVEEQLEQPAIEAEKAAPVESEDDHEEEDTEESAISDDGDDTAAHPKKYKGVGKRINELTREKHEALRRAEAEAAEKEYWRKLVLANQRPADANAQQENALGKPTLEQFNYDQEAYQEARDKWVFEQVEQRVMERINAAEETKKRQEKTSAFQKQIEEIENESPGAWERALSAPISFSQTMLEVLQESPIGARVGVYLTENLDEAFAISQLPPIRQTAALGQIEERLKAKLSAPRQKPSAPPQKPITKAPAPPPVMQSAATIKKPISQWTVEDHIEAVRANQTR